MWSWEPALVALLFPLLASLGACANLTEICTGVGPRGPETIYGDAIFESWGPYYIYSQEDVDILTQNNCTTIYSPVIISPNSTTSNISLNSILDIWSHLEVVSSPSLTKVSAPSLISIFGNFALNNLSSLSEIDFPSLTNSDTLILNSLPQLKSFSFPNASKGLITSSINISQTGLTTIQGSYLIHDDLIIVNNTNLQIVNLTNDLLATNTLISGNGAQTTIYLSAKSGHSRTANLQIEDCAAVNIPNLSGATNMIFQDNGFAELSLPALEVVQALIIKDNTNLSTINLPAISYVTDLDIESNSLLGLQILVPSFYQTNALTLAGNFTILPYEGDLPSSIHINSTVPGFDCSGYDSRSQYIPNNYSCRASAPGSDKDTAIHLPCLHHRCLSTVDKAGIGAGAAVSVLLIVLVALWFFRWRKMPSDASNGPWYMRLRAWAEIFSSVPKPPKYVDSTEMQPPRYQDLEAESDLDRETRVGGTD